MQCIASLRQIKIIMKKKFIILVFLVVNIQVLFSQESRTINVTPQGFSGDFTGLQYFQNTGLVAIGSSNKLYVSADTAKTWQVRDCPIDSVKQILVNTDKVTGYIFNTHKVYQTEDAADTWTELTLQGVPQTYLGYKLEIMNLFQKNIDTLFLITTYRINGLKIYMSPNKGATWELVAENINNNYSWTTIYDMHFTTSLHGYGYGYGCYITTNDGGKTWTNTILSSFERHIRKVYSYSNGKAVMYYQDLSEPLKSLNISNTGDPVNNMVQTKIVDNIIISFQGFNNIVYGIGEDGKFYASTDSAKTWTVSTIATNTYGSLTLKGGYFFNAQVGVVVGRNLTSFVTLNGGITWTKYVHGGAEGFNKIYCKNEQECFITGQTGRLFRTQDGGNTWTYSDIHNGSLQEIEFPTPDTGYVVGPYVLFRTIDGGDSWTKITHTLTNAGIIEFPTKDVGFMGYPSGQYSIYKTEDNGNIWTRYAGMTYLTNKTTSGGGFSFRNELEGLVCADDNKLLYTDNGCTTWQVINSIPLGLTTYDIVSVNDIGWLIQILHSGQSDIYFCDNTFNCQEVFNGNGENAGNLQKVNDSLFFISHDTLEYFSYDYGLTWESLDFNIPGLIDVVNQNLSYSITVYTTGIYKTLINSQNPTLAIQKQSNREYTVTLTDISSAITADIYIKDAIGNKTKIASQVSLQNGVAYNLTIPQSVAQGTYTLYIEPITSGYLPVESESITIDSTSAITNVTKQDCFTVKNSTIYIYSQKPVKVYNIIGIQIPYQGSKVELQSGIYILQSECGVEKIFIK